MNLKLDLELPRNLAKLFLVQVSNQNEPENSSDIEPQKVFTNEIPTPDNPPWNSLTALGVWIMSVVFIIIFPNLFLLPYLSKQSLNFPDQARMLEFVKTDPTAVFLQLLAIIPAHIFTLILAWFVVTKFNKYSFLQTLGWRWGGFKFRHAALILVGFFIFAAVVSYFFPEQENDFTQILRSSRMATVTVALIATFSAPLVEEVVYRGILFSGFQKNFGTKVGFLLVAMIFGSVHILQYYPSYSTIFLIFVLSVILTLVRIRTKNLLPCVVLHTLINGVQSIFLVLQLYLPELNALESKTSSIIYWLK